MTTPLSFRKGFEAGNQNGPLYGSRISFSLCIPSANWCVSDEPGLHTAPAVTPFPHLTIFVWGRWVSSSQGRQRLVCPTGEHPTAAQDTDDFTQLTRPQVTRCDARAPLAQARLTSHLSGHLAERHRIGQLLLGRGVQIKESLPLHLWRVAKSGQTFRLWSQIGRYTAFVMITTGLQRVLRVRI